MRVRKKLTERENWYKDKEKDQDLDEENQKRREKEGGKMQKSRKDQARAQAHAAGGKDAEKRQPVQGASVVKAAMFVPYTPHSGLAKELRELEYELEKIVGYRLKIVERAGDKLQDLLTTSNPWKGELCERQGCMLCETKLRTGKSLKQDCSKRSLVYETMCKNCYDEDMRKIEEDEEMGEEMKKRKMKDIRVYKYIGETARSIFERTREHKSDAEQLNPSSHMLKHILDQHEGERPEEIVFNVKVLYYCKSSYERQILESCLIQSERSHYLLNSKAEYNRSAVPRLTIKLGEKQYKKWEKDNEKEMKRNEELESKIRDMRKMRNKGRRHNHPREGPAQKRRKMEGGEYREMKNPSKTYSLTEETGKREKDLSGEEKDKDEERQPVRKKMRQMKIGEKREKDLSRYQEFGETEERWELYDWESNLKEYKRKLEEEDRLRKMKKEKADKLSKGWELMRACRDYIEENSKTWNNEEELRRQKKDEEEKKMERLRQAAIKKGRAKENEVQRKITETWKKIPQNEKEIFVESENREKRREMRNIRENMWKKWRKDRNKETRSKEKDEMEIKRSKSQEETLRKLDEILHRLKEEEKSRKDAEEKERERRRIWKKEKDAEERKALIYIRFYSRSSSRNK